MAADRSPRAFAIVAALGLAVLATVESACAKDVILPVPTTCGDGKVTGDETCDTAAPTAGCVACRVQPGWQCTEQTCATVCGDGVVAGDEECDSTDRTACDSSCRAGSRAGCDAEGWWATRQKSFSIDDIFNEVQTTSNWFLWHAHDLAEDGSFEIDAALNCGIQVSSSKVDVNLTPAGIDGLMYKAAQDGSGGRPPRKGRWQTFSNGSCGIDVDRHYFVRGCDESLLPDETAPPWPDFATLDQQKPLPCTVAFTNGCTADDVAKATDDDANGLPGVAWVVSRGASGVRDTAQRDWGEYFSDPNEADPRYQIASGSLEFDVRAHFDNEEHILAITQCPPIGCGPLKAASKPSATLQHRIRMRWLGTSLDDPRVAAIVVGPPHADAKADATTCENLRNALPHDPTAE